MYCVAIAFWLGDVCMMGGSCPRCSIAMGRKPGTRAEIETWLAQC